MPPDTSPSQITALAETIFNRLAQQFPVCMGSDEFHFFPQVRATAEYDSGWDDFSPEALQALLSEMAAWLRRTEDLKAQFLSKEDSVDIETLGDVLQTLREQLTDVGWHRHQPTWYLTIMGIGLAEAAEETSGRLAARLETLPRFLDQARGNLERMPSLFRDLGCDMIQGLRPWLTTLPADPRLCASASDAIEAFRHTLESAPTTQDCLLDRDLYERMARHHMGCRQATDDIAGELEDEIRETRSLLDDLSRRMAPAVTWQNVIAGLPPVPLPPAGVGALYQTVIADLDQEDFDLAVLDVKIPGINGINLRKKMKEKCPDMKFIFMTGHGSQDDYAAGSAETGVDYYLLKPVTIDELIKKIYIANISKI